MVECKKILLLKILSQFIRYFRKKITTDRPLRKYNHRGAGNYTIHKTTSMKHVVVPVSRYKTITPLDTTMYNIYTLITKRTKVFSTTTPVFIAGSFSCWRDINKRKSVCKRVRGLTVEANEKHKDAIVYVFEKTTNKLEKVALNGSVECCAPPPRWCDLELWPVDPKT